MVTLAKKEFGCDLTTLRVNYPPLPIILYFTTMQHPTYLVVYMFWMKILLVELAPYIAIAVLNLALINK